MESRNWTYAIPIGSEKSARNEGSGRRGTGHMSAMRLLPFAAAVVRG